MSSETNRREFIFKSLRTGAALAAISPILSGCSTLDEYLFEDSFFLKDKVLIVGGGLGGLYLAHRLQFNKVGLRLFEGSSRMGGRVQSIKQIDYGASIFSSDDQILRSLLKEFDMATTQLDKSHFYLPGGMQELIDRLVEQISGLIVYRSIRLRWKVISVQRIKQFHEVVFETPRGRRTVIVRKLALAIPPSQWSRIHGLDEIPEMKSALTWASSLRKENTVKVILTTEQQFVSNAPFKSLNYFEDDNLQARQIFKKVKGTSWLELDFKSVQPGASIEIVRINDFIRKKMNINFTTAKMAGENYFDWNAVDLIQGSAFTSPLVFPEIKSGTFQIVGDFASPLKPQSLEGALQSAARSAEFLT